MGKKRYGGDFDSFEGFDTYEQMRQQLERKLAKNAIKCSHTNENGKLKIEPTGEPGMVRCKRCGTKFSFNRIDKTDGEKACRVIHDMINQIKVLSEVPKNDAEIISRLGNIDFELLDVLMIYQRSLERYHNDKKKKKKKEYHRGDDFGGWGVPQSINGKKRYR